MTTRSASGGGLGDGRTAQALGLGLGPALAALGEPDAHVDPAVAQAQRVGVALAAVSDDGDLAPLDDRQVGVVVVEHLGHGVGFSSVLWCCSVVRGAGRCRRMPGARGCGSGSAQRAVGDGAGAASDGDDAGLDELAHAVGLEDPEQGRRASRAGPVASIVTDSVATSTTLARNSWTSSRTWLRVAASARTLMSITWRWTAEAASSSTTLSTSTSLLSCLVTCSSGRSSTSTTTVMREISRARSRPPRASGC